MGVVVGVEVGVSTGAEGATVGAAVGLQCVGVAKGGPSYDKQLSLRSIFVTAGGKWDLSSLVSLTVIR